MLAFIEKYLAYFKWGGIAVALLAWTGFIWTSAATRTELSYTKTTNGALQTQLDTKDAFMKNYQDLVNANLDLRNKLDVASNQNQQLIQERQNANQAATLDLIAALRDPARSVYAKDSNCGEAGNYPTVFGTTVGPVSPTP